MLGDDFDIRAFHDAILGQGSMPLNALDLQIDAWIANQLAADDELTDTHSP